MGWGSRDRGRYPHGEQPGDLEDRPKRELCDCRLNLATKERTYCAEHQPAPTPKGQATAAIGRARAMVTPTPVNGLGVLDAITLRGYLDYALEQLGKVHELKKARPGEGKPRKKA